MVLMYRMECLKLETKLYYILSERVRKPENVEYVFSCTLFLCILPCSFSFLSRS